ncbi:hypothetical protein [Tardiphaga sp.]|uniref:hypothetical protein n=1 Tax=Tardiphaga sp. TaxID=1926292 RepID=UPI00352ADCB0
MPDEIAEPAPAATPLISNERKDQLVFRLVYIGFLVSGAIALLVIGGVIFIALLSVSRGVDMKIPDVLANWGGVIVGFYFGAFVTLIKDYIKISA